MRRATLVAALLLAALLPLSGTAAEKVYALRGARIHTLAPPAAGQAGSVIERGTVVVRDGRIAAVGAEVAVPAGAEVIDVTGLEIYPGLFDSYSRLGLTEVGAVSATVDTSEAGDFNPHLLAAAAIHPASEHIPVARANGITHAVSAPGSGGPLMGGQASLINLDGWTIEEMLVRPSVGLVVNWPTLRTRTFDTSTFSFRERPFTEVKKSTTKKSPSWWSGWRRRGTTRRRRRRARRKSSRGGRNWRRWRRWCAGIAPCWWRPTARATSATRWSSARSRG